MDRFFSGFTSMLLAVVFAVLLYPEPGRTEHPYPPPFVQARLVAEMGFLYPMYHRVQFSRDNTYFDYRKDGGQNNAFFFNRYSVEMVFDNQHTLIALYQPLQLRTSVTLTEDLLIDDILFPAQTPVNLRYGFDFYRISYAGDVLKDKPATELSIGASLQMRNAVINFTSADGTLRRSNQDVGPVPLFKVRFRQRIRTRFWVGAEMDGIWAPIKYINGSDSDVEGALLDLSITAGYNLARSLDGFVNIRYLAGGAEGTSSDDSGPGDGYTRNWLHFLTVSLGLQWAPTDL